MIPQPPVEPRELPSQEREALIVVAILDQLVAVGAKFSKTNPNVASSARGAK